LKYADDIANDKQENTQCPISKVTPITPEEKKKTLNRKQLINKLNFINFLDGTITVDFRHRKFDGTISLQAKPLPCLDHSLDCIWLENENVVQKLRMYNFLHFILPDNHKLILVEAEIRKIDEEGISFYLPDFCDEISSRTVKRYPCEGIRIQLMQHGAIFHGELIDFNAVSFKVEVVATPPQSFQWVNSETPVTVVAGTDQEILYSGECEITRQSCGQQVRSFVLKPLHAHIRRFKPREYRSTRHKLVPSPNIIFKDPFTGKTVNLKVLDLSGSGFSVEEDAHNSVLLPGKIIPEVSIDFANVFQITCKSQVIYRKEYNSNSSIHDTVKCGLAILDMDLKDHVRLLGFLQQAEDPNTYVCTRVALEELWDFFFETGFIYPKKYTFIQQYKEKFRDTYEKLYTDNPNIARYFIFQQNGVIYGHMSMIRFYRKSWLIQHHASRKSSSYRPGLLVLNQISRYVNDIYKLYSAHLDFVCCYFRDDNKFPRRVFGGVAKHIDDLKGCSVNRFAYFHYKSSSNKWDLSGPWMLSKARSDDIGELENFYNHDSGGLMLNALDLDPHTVDYDDLSKEYRKLGFKRERHLFALKKDCILKAIIIVNTSDIGLNMSDLTNCMKVIVLDENDLPKDTLYLVLSLLSSKFEQEEIPVLLYPERYAEKQFIPCERKYSFWVLNLQYLDQYFSFCEKLMNHVWHD
jgi:hypothetical protein